MRKLHFLKYMISACFILSYVLSFGQTSSMGGKITDETNQPLAGTVVSLQGNTSQKTATGSDGRYHFNNVPHGTCIVRISSIGYQVITRDIYELGRASLMRRVLFRSSYVLSFAQTSSMGGKRTDETNQPLAGTVVSLQGNRSQKTATGSDGRYRFNNVPYGTYIVRISSIGYQEITRDILVQDGGQLIVDFKMEPIATGLEQVVVVGYGTQKRRDVTGAVATISSEDLNQGPITNPLQQISGKAAGVHVNQVGGEPGSAPNVRIRGISSLIGGNDPLVVIDG